MGNHTNSIRFERTATHISSSMPYMHVHSEWELYFLISGQRRYFMGHTIYDISPGNVVIVPAMQLHRTVNLGSKGYDRHIIYFTREYIESFFTLVGCERSDVINNGGCFQLPRSIVWQLQKIFEQIEQEFSEPDQWTQPSAKQLLSNILLSIIRYGKQNEPCQEETAGNIQTVARYISEHFADAMTLEDAAQLAHMEKTYFSKRFKALTGFGFLEFLTQTRIRAAEQLLTETELSIVDIAELTGFSCSNYFGDVFRRYKGISPTAYRTQSSATKLEEEHS